MYLITVLWPLRIWVEQLFGDAMNADFFVATIELNETGVHYIFYRMSQS